MNVWMTSFSALLFLFIAFLMSFWFGPTLQFAFAGFAIGGLLGLLGLVLTRWEVQHEGLFYTPSRSVAVVFTFSITAPFVFGWWGATHPGNNPPRQQHLLTSGSATQVSFSVPPRLIFF